MTYQPPAGYIGTEISLIRQMNQKAREGTINLGLGQLPYEPPQIAIDSMVEALNEGKVTYTANAGSLEVREAIAARHYKRSGKGVLPSEVVITQGVEQALFNTISVFANGNSRILIPEIGFSVYEDIPKYIGGIEVEKYKLCDDLTVDTVDLERRVLRDDKQTLIVVNTPSNPTGQIINDTSAYTIGKHILNIRDNTFLLSDEVYSELYFSNSAPASMARHSDKVITADGISKSGAATGIRIGWTIAPQEITEQMVKLQQHITCCAPTPNQYFALPIIDGRADENIKEYREKLRENNKFVQSALDTTHLLSAQPSQGSFYSFVDVSQITDSQSFADSLLEEENVLTIPGKAFGDTGENYVRISFATDKNKLEEGLERLVRFAQRRA